MPAHIIKTIHLEHNPSKAREHAFDRRAPDVEYVTAIAESVNHQRKAAARDENDRILSSIARASRGMCLSTTSTSLERLEYTPQEDTLTINELGRKGFGVHQFIKVVWRCTDLPVDTAARRVAFHCEGSPKARVVGASQ